MVATGDLSAGHARTVLAFEGEDARVAANLASEEPKALRKQLQDSADATGINQRQAELRRNLNEAEDKLRASQPQKERPQPTRGILVGDTVELLKLGTKASVIAINKDGTYQLQAGILKPEIALAWRFDLPFETAEQVAAIRQKYMQVD